MPGMAPVTNIGFIAKYSILLHLQENIYFVQNMAVSDPFMNVISVEFPAFIKEIFSMIARTLTDSNIRTGAPRKV